MSTFHARPKTLFPRVTFKALVLKHKKKLHHRSICLHLQYSETAMQKILSCHTSAAQPDWLPAENGPQRHVVVSLWRSASARRTGCLRVCSLPDLPGWPWNQKLGTAPALSKPRFPVSLLELRCNYCDSWIRRPAWSRAGEMAASTRIRPWSFFLFEDRGDVGVWRKNITHI